MPDPADLAYANRVQQQSDAQLARSVAANYPELDTKPVVNPTFPQRTPEQGAEMARQVEGPGGGETTDVPFGSDPVTAIPSLAQAGAVGGVRAALAGAATIPLASDAASDTQAMLLKKFPDKPWIANVVGGMLPSLAIMGGAGAMTAMSQPKGAPAVASEPPNPTTETAEPEPLPKGTILDAKGEPMNAPVAEKPTPKAVKLGEFRDLQRIEPAGVTPDFNKPQGLYMSPAGVESPHREGPTDAQFNYSANPKNPLDVSGAEAIPLRKGAVDSGAGAKALQILDPDLFEKLRTATPDAFKEDAADLLPGVDTSKFFDRQETIEAIGAKKARDAGYDALISRDKDPSFSEFVALSPDAVTEKPPPPPPPEPPPITPEAASQTLAQKQLDALKTARVGQSVATEFGKPELATQMSEAETLKNAQDLRLNLESVFNKPVEPPTMSTETAALAKVFSGEATDLHSTAVDILKRSASGEDVTADLNTLNNRFSSFAVQYAKIAGTRSEAGRTLQILDPLKPENLRVTQTAKLAQELGAGDNPSQLAEMLARLDPDRIARAGRQIAETSDSTPGGVSAFGDGLMEYYRSNLLSNPATVSRIGLSNAITSLAEIPVRAVAARMPGATVESGEASAMMRGIVDGFPDAVRYAGKSFMSGQPEFDMSSGVQFMPRSEPSITAEHLGFDPDSVVGKGVDYLGSAIRLPYRGITAVHQFGYAMASSMQMHALAWRQAVSDAADEGLLGSAASQRAEELYAKTLNDPPTDLVNAAKEFGQTTTFINKLEGKVPQALSTLANAPGLNLVVPFFRTPYNIFKYGMDFSPLGIATQYKALTGGPSATRDIALAKVGLGSLMAGIAAHEAVSGTLTGDGPDNPDAVAALRRQGWQPNSIRVGNHWVEIPEPFRQPLTLVANAVELMNDLDSPTAGQVATAATLATVRSFTNSSFVQGLANLRAAVGEAADQGIGTVGERFIGQEAKGFVPFSSGLAALTRAEDPTIRNTQAWFDQIKAGIPGLSKSLPPKLDVYGDVVQGLPGIPENMLFPVRVTEQTHDPVDQAIIDTNASFAKAPKYISGRAQHALDNPNDPDIGVPLSPEQQYQWAKNRGEGLKQQLSDLINSDGYKQGSTLMKKQLLEFVGSKYSQIATLKLLRDDPTLMAAYTARMQNRSTALLPSDATLTSPEASAE